jgi:hypothetical protein
MEIKINGIIPMRWQFNFDATVDGKDYEICVLVDDDGIEWDNLMVYNEKDSCFEHTDSGDLPDELVNAIDDMKFKEGVLI